MAIAPNSTFRIYKGVPLDNTYNHTLWFDNLSAQRTYFSASNAKHSLSKQTYQRVESGIMNVNIPIGDLYDCNYCAFQNTSYGTKWFYAFITSCEYINDVTSQISYEIDDMQTYLFDVHLLDCFVDREHSSTDEVGDNIVSEPFQITEYFSDTDTNTGLFNRYTVAMVSPFKVLTGTTIWEKAYTDFQITGNPNLLINYFYDGNDLREALGRFSADLFELNQDEKGSQLTCVYIIPSGFVSDLPTENYRGKLPEYEVTRDVDFGLKKTILGWYTPRNKKLLTYPYQKCTITTYADEQDYAYEYFSGTNVTFRVHANLTPNASFKCNPLNYKGDNENYDEGVVLSDLPLMAYSNDNYAAWLARNKTRLGVQALSTVVSGITGNIMGGQALVTAGQQMLTPKTKVLSSKGAEKMARGYEQMYEGAIETPLNGITNLLTESIGAKHLGSSTQGSTDGSLELAMGKKDFNYIHKYMNPKDAQLIDDYFDMYGYATRRIKTPNRNVRKHWTYTKTNGCIVRGEAPQNAIRHICAIYDNGITFWKHASEVGDYSTSMKVDNTPL